MLSSPDRCGVMKLNNAWSATLAKTSCLRRQVPQLASPIFASEVHVWCANGLFDLQFATPQHAFLVAARGGPCVEPRKKPGTQRQPECPLPRSFWIVVAAAQQGWADLARWRPHSSPEKRRRSGGRCVLGQRVCQRCPTMWP